MATKQFSLFGSDETVYEIKKHSGIVQMGNITTLQERKTLNALLWISKDILKRVPDERLFVCDLGLLKRLAGNKDSDNVELKNALRNLKNRQIEYNVFNKDNGKIWGILSFLAEVKIVEEWVGKPTTITFEFPSTVLETIKNPSMFVKLDLLMMRGFTSKHSIALYEFLKDYIKLGKIRCELSDFRKLMGIQENQYEIFTMLKKRVLDTAIDEINAKTDIICSYDIERQGRLTTALIFKMNTKQSHVSEHLMNDSISQKLKHYGIQEKRIDELLAKHDTQYLLANIEIVEEQIKKGEVQNVSAYLMKSFSNDFRIQETEHTKQLQQAMQERKAKEQEQQQQELAEKKLKEQYYTERKIHVEEYLKTLSENEVQTLQNTFIQTQEKNLFFIKAYRQGGMTNPIAQAGRVNYIATTFLQAPYKTFEDYKSYLQNQ